MKTKFQVPGDPSYQPLTLPLEKHHISEFPTQSK